uniref:Peptidase S1 domain-containing protein n=1 Tax=Xiphophorus couchianus TaxID=32473 RepID=A0A3B5LBH6_9TELE
MALLKVLLLLLGLGVAVSSVSLQKRIIGGQNCRDDERHYHVKVFAFNRTKEKLCGGSLISDQKTKKSPITDGFFNNYSNGREHDIMLLKLPVKITAIRPIRLPDCPDTLLLGTKVQIAGFGATQQSVSTDFTCLRCFSSTVKDSPDGLQCAEFKIVTNEKLEKTMAKLEYFKRTYQKWYSAGSSKKDPSQGDSGGGFVFNNRLYGVMAFTGDPWYAFNEPSGFTDVCAYKQWIDDTIN